MKTEFKYFYLRKLEEGDICDLFELLSDRRVIAYMCIPIQSDIDDCFMMMCRNDFFENDHMWGIVDRMNERVVGVIELYDIVDGIGQLGFYLHIDYWHKGWMKKALISILYYIFEEYGLNRIEAFRALENMNCFYLLDRLHFTRMKKECYEVLSDGRLHQMLGYKLDKEDWRKTYEQNIRS